MKDSVSIGSRGKEAAYVFVSLDLCDFTAIKAKWAQWADVIWKIFDLIDDGFLQMVFWKFNGDEFLFYREVSNLVDIIELIESANTVVHYMELGLNAELRSENVHIKAGVWLANTEECVLSQPQPSISDVNYKFSNRYTGYKKFDFIGANMDEGFRMLSCATQGRFVVDPKIAIMFHALYTLMEHDTTNALTNEYIDEVQAKAPDFYYACNKFSSLDDDALNTRIRHFAENLVFVGQVPLKGIWNGQHYPVIWFSSVWAKEYTPLETDKFTVCISSDNNPHPVCNLDKLYRLFRKARKDRNLYKLMKLMKVCPPAELIMNRRV